MDVYIVSAWFILGAISVLTAYFIDNKNQPQSNWFFLFNDRNHQFLVTPIDTLVMTLLGPIGFVFPLGANWVMKFIEYIKLKLNLN